MLRRRSFHPCSRGLALGLFALVAVHSPLASAQQPVPLLPPPSPGDVPPGSSPTPYPYPYPYPYAPYPYPTPTAGMPPSQDPYLLPMPLPRRRRNVGLFVSGVTAVGVGMGMVLLGSYFVASAAGRIDIYCDMPSIPCAHKTDAQRMTGGAITMALGAALGAAGIPMWLVGSQYVVIPKDERRPTAAVDMGVGLGTASVTLHF